MADKTLTWNPLTMTAGDLNQLAKEVYTLKMYITRIRESDEEVDLGALGGYAIQMLDGWEVK